MKNIFSISTLAVLAITVWSCNLEKEVDLDLPAYDRQPVVECYLEPGQPFNLLLSRSVSFFDPFPADSTFLDQLLIDDATVSIEHGGKLYPLSNGFFFNPLTLKFFNYGSTELVPQTFDTDFKLRITLADGKTISAMTQILRPVPIDSIVVQFPSDEPKDSLARVLTYLTDDASQVNFYRRQIHENNLRDSLPDQDFISTDRFVDNQVLAFGTGYDFAVGDTVYNTVYHISHDYFDYLESAFNASASNANPFGQPSTIVSNLGGDAIGIFTGLSYVRVMTIIKR
jgi:hypothetical protein